MEHPNIPKKLHIPEDSVYKVQWITDAVTAAADNTTLVFARGEAKFVSKETEILSSQQIHPDDSIRVVKKKILSELWKHGHSQIAYEDLYLTAYVEANDTAHQLYRSVMGDRDDGMTHAQFSKIAHELGWPEREATAAAAAAAETTYSLADFIRMVSSVQEGAEGAQPPHPRLSVRSILGQRFVGKRDPLFSVSPFRLKEGELKTTVARWKKNAHRLVVFENELLLNYGEIAHRTLYLYVAEQVLAAPHAQPADLALQIYFPLLYAADVRTVEDWSASQTERLRQSKEWMSERSFHLYDSIQLFYDTYYGRTAELPYGEGADSARGISSFQLRIDTGVQNQLPLETIFKNIHCSREIPFIKFHPGPRRENLYRLYYNRITKDGTKIPFLSERTIMRMVRERGKSNRISMYILHSNVETTLPIYLHFDKDGFLSVSCDLKHALSLKEVNALLRESLNPVLHQLNLFLKSTGFSIRPFSSLDAASVEVTSLAYVLRIPIHNKLNLNTIGCIYGIFEKASAPNQYTEKPGYGNASHWRYKRVANYVEMDAESALIRQLHRPPNAVTDVMNGLMEQFGMTAEEAKTRYIDFLRTHVEIEGEVVDNPGFPVVFREKQLDNLLEIEVHEITSIAYLERIQLYIDSILRITQNIRSTSVSRDHVNTVCRRTKDADHADVSHIENVMVSAAAAVVPIRDREFNLAEELGFTPEKEVDEDATATATATGAADRWMEELEGEEEGEIDKEEYLGILGEEADADRKTQMQSFYEEQRRLSEPLESPETPDVEDSPVMLSPEEETVSNQSVVNEPIEPPASNAPPAAAPTAATAAAAPSPQDYSDEESDDGVFLSPDSTATPEDSQTGGAGGAKAKAPPKTTVKTTAAKEDSDHEEDEDDPEEEHAIESGDPDALEDRYLINPDGAPLKSNSNPFLKRMMRADPTLFLTSKQGKYKAYARSCQHGRHPVLLTDAEKQKIDRENPGSYEHAIRYGTDAKHANWYICPRFWCFLTNTSITEEDVKAGKCGKIIPKNAKKIPHGSYVYEFTSEDHHDTKGNYLQHHPGFMPEGRHPEGHCLPCCYKNWDTASQATRRQQCAMPEETEETAQSAREPATATATAATAAAVPLSVIRYIISLDTYPLPSMRWGFLPIPVQLFLNMDYANTLEKTNSAMILPNVSTLLRSGVEQTPKQSFLGAFADIYAHYNYLPAVPSVAEFKQMIWKKITIDVFVRLHNASLVATFRPAEVPKLSKADLAKMGVKVRTKESDELSLEYWSDAVAAYEQFRAFFLSSQSEIDHTYMWDILSSDLLYPIGMNLILLEIVENDMTDTIQLICPTDAFSGKWFDPKKPCWMVLKHDQFYEPIYEYHYNGKTIDTQKLFTSTSLNKTIRDMVKNIQRTTNKYCAPLPSLPKVYSFRETVPLETVASILKDEGYAIQKQVMHYNGKIVGVVAKRVFRPTIEKTAAKLPPAHPVYLPCHPSAPLPKIPAISMDDVEDYATDYETTKSRLESLHENLMQRVPCLPKLKVLEKHLVVGFLTETNQFVPIQPPSENIADDGLPSVEYGNFHDADKSFAENRPPDRTRAQLVKKIQLENQFYRLFRNSIREFMQETSDIQKEIESVLDHIGHTYQKKRTLVEKQLRDLVHKRIVFHDMDDSVLMEMGDVLECSEYTSDETAYCLVKENGAPQLVIPKRHLLSGMNNETVYYGRMADELVRNGRVRLFMMQPKKYLNVHDTEYHIHANEFLMIQSQLLDKDVSRRYFADAVAWNTDEAMTHTTYDTARPAIHPKHLDAKIKWDEQNAHADNDMTCIKEMVPVVGNNQSMWKRMFPDTTREIVFFNTAQCTFYPLVYVIMSKFPNRLQKPTAVSYVKQLIWASYWKFLDTPAKTTTYLPKFLAILKKQGKQRMAAQVEKGAIKLEEWVLSDTYYMTDLDIWVVAHALNLPIVVFNANGIKGFGKLDWIKMGGELNEKHFFVRSTVTTDPNHISSYHLIQPAYKLNALSILNTMIMKSVRRETDEYDAHVQRFDQFLLR